MAVYLGTATPSAYYLGSTTVSAIYLGSNQVYPVASGATFFGPNSVWNGVGFSGAGTSSNKYLKASISGGTADGMWIRASAAGTVYITADSIATDDMFVIAKSTNSLSWTNVYTAGDSGGWSTSSAFSLSFAVSANDYIQIARPVDSEGYSITPYARFTNLRVWWQ
jgi:hypothetical protein